MRLDRKLAIQWRDEITNIKVISGPTNLFSPHSMGVKEVNAYPAKWCFCKRFMFRCADDEQTIAIFHRVVSYCRRICQLPVIDRGDSFCEADTETQSPLNIL